MKTLLLVMVTVVFSSSAMAAVGANPQVNCAELNKAAKAKQLEVDKKDGKPAEDKAAADAK